MIAKLFEFFMNLPLDFKAIYVLSLVLGIFFGKKSLNNSRWKDLFGLTSVFLIMVFIILTLLIIVRALSN
jgi:hypothetical protein